MLPDFPKTRAELERVIRSQIHRRADQLFVVRTLVQGFTQHEGGEHQAPGPDGALAASKYGFVGVENTLKPEGVRYTDPGALSRHVESIATELAQKHSAAFYEVLDSAKEHVAGKISFLDGMPTQEDLLAAVEKTEWSPDSVFLTHPAMAKEMVETWKDWQEDTDFMAKLKSVESRKKEEFRARESRRKLVS